MIVIDAVALRPEYESRSIQPDQARDCHQAFASRPDIPWGTLHFHGYGRAILDHNEFSGHEFDRIDRTRDSTLKEE